MPRPRSAHIAYRTDTNKWTVRWRTPDNREHRRTYHTEEAAREAATRITAQLRGELPPAPALRTIGHLLAVWWDHHAPTLKPNTRTLYASCMRLLLDSALAPMYASAVDTATITALLDNLDLSASRRRTCIIILSGAYKNAIRNRLAADNPVAYVKRPAQGRTRIIPPSRADLIRFACTVPAPDAKWRSLLAVAAYCGLRPQEQFALTWDDIDLRRIHVTRAVSTSTRTLDQTKTLRGVRSVPLPRPVFDLLEAWRSEAPDTQTIWATQAGTLLDPSRFNHRTWQAWQDAAGVQVQWRTWRHYYASELAASGASLLQASRWMGHSRFSVTMDYYADWFDEDADSVIEGLGW